MRNPETRVAPLPLRGAALLLPYVALAVGLGIFHDGWVALGLYHAGALVFIARLRRPLGWIGPAWTAPPDWIRGRGRPRALSIWRAGLVLGLAVLGASGLGLMAALWGPLDLGARVSAQLSHYGLTGSRWTAFVAYHVLVNPWIEEMLWRGRLGSSSPWPVGSDLLFAGYHGLSLWGSAPWAGIVVGIALLTAGAWFWRQTAERGGLLLAVISHAVGDLTVLLGVTLLGG